MVELNKHKQNRIKFNWTQTKHGLTEQTQTKPNRTQTKGKNLTEHKPNVVKLKKHKPNQKSSHDTTGREMDTCPSRASCKKWGVYKKRTGKSIVSLGRIVGGDAGKCRRTKPRSCWAFLPTHVLILLRFCFFFFYYYYFLPIHLRFWALILQLGIWLDRSLGMRISNSSWDFIVFDLWWLGLG